MTGGIAVGPRDVLIVVDVQNDFCPGGALAVPGGHEVVAAINRLAGRFQHVLLTQDWHPPGHRSFASAHPGRKPYETIEVSYGEQILWPEHCVQGTPGALLRDDLQIPHAQLVLRKGYHLAIDSYSAFYENDRTTRTGLAGYLRERGLTRVLPGRARVRFLCPLLGRGCTARRLRGRGDRGCLSRDRRQRIHGRCVQDTGRHGSPQHHGGRCRMNDDRARPEPEDGGF